MGIEPKANDLARLIANLGYPVGMGIAPHPRDAERIAVSLRTRGQEEVPDGWVLVPRIPTDAMIDAAMNARELRLKQRAQASGGLVIGGASAAYTFHDTYRAMLAAAPTLNEQGGPHERRP